MNSPIPGRDSLSDCSVQSQSVKPVQRYTSLGTCGKF